MPPDSWLELLLGYFNTTTVRGFVVLWICAVVVVDIVALLKAEAQDRFDITPRQ